MAPTMVQGKRLWGFDDSERGLLVEATTNLGELRAVVERAERTDQFGGMWLVQATARELDEMYSLVEALMGGTRSRKRLDLLEGMRASLCNSIDGY